MRICPKCNVVLHLLLPDDDPWQSDHYICPMCDGTYDIWDKETIRESYKKDVDIPDVSDNIDEQ